MIRICFIFLKICVYPCPSVAKKIFLKGENMSIKFTCDLNGATTDLPHFLGTHRRQRTRAARASCRLAGAIKKGTL